MERTYTVLRTAGGAAVQAGPAVARSAAPRTVRGATGGEVPVPSVEVTTLGRGELADVVRDPQVRAVAPVMPTRLIAPVPVASDEVVVDDAPPPGPTWGVRAVGADRSTRTGAGVTVAVLDTGIDATHPAFAGVRLVQEDFSGAGIGDVQGHGTHCAGTVFGRDVDGVRIGVAPGVTTALIGKVLRDDGGGDSDMIFRGIQWAVQEGAAVVSMSLGFDFPGFVTQLVGEGWPTDLATSAALEGYRTNLRMFDALMQVVRARAAFGPGALLVAAAGNESRRELDADYEIAVSIPAAAEGVVSVGALGRSDGGLLGVAPFSNTLPVIAAPGVGVVSAESGTGGLVALSGTSMATPHVAGVAALWWEEVAALSVPQTAATVLSRMLAGADTTAIDPEVDVADRGVGLVRAP